MNVSITPDSGAHAMPATAGAVIALRLPTRHRAGPGYLAGEFPGGVTTVDGVPTRAVVRVLRRAPGVPEEDGLPITEVESGPDGTWRVDGLLPSLRYDVIGRKDGFNDVIVSNVQPAV